MRKIVLEMNEDVFEEATNVLDELGMDVQGAVRMFLKRIVRDRSIAFVLPNAEGIAMSRPTVTRVPANEAVERLDVGVMRKNAAVRLLRDRGHYIQDTVTFSSKNKSSFFYWANPDFSVLNENWTLILNDWVNRKLYLFQIPANSIHASQVVARNDKKEKIDLEITGGDTFTDKISGYRFRQFLVDEINY